MGFIFGLLMFAIFGRLIYFALKLTWGVGKIFFGIIMVPLMLIGLVLRGLLSIALPILIVVGIISLLTVPKRD